MVNFVPPTPNTSKGKPDEPLALTTSVAERSDRLLRQPWRVGAVAVLLALLGGVLILRLLDMQIRLWNFYSEPVASAQTTSALGNDATRGIIVDRDGEPLAIDRYVYQVTATPRNIPEDLWEGVAQLLEEYAGIPAASTRATLSENKDGYYAVLAKELDFQQGRKLQQIKRQILENKDLEDDLLVNNVFVVAKPLRFYPQYRLASQLIGFVNGERTAVLGLERYYDSFLRYDGVGLPRGKWQSRDTLPDETLRYLPTDAGKSLVLTLDRTIQWIIEDELAQGIEVYGAQGGTIIVMDPKTGAILGMANEPSFDPNNYLQEDPNYFTNPAISAQYEPGSIFKIITMAAAVDAGVVESTSTFTDTGTIVVGQRTFRNSSRTAAGVITVADALALSDNVVTIQVALELGVKKFYQAVNRFGFGQATEIDLANESAGIVKAPGNPKWSEADLAANSFGQGIAVTPMQMVMATGAIANGGQLMRPYVVQARIQGDYVLPTEPTVVRRVLKPESAATMTEMMIHTVEAGNQAARVPGYTVAGKSGTAEIASNGGYTEKETIASFVGFAPADDPQFVVLVKLDRPDPSISPWAAKTAAPIFSRVAYRLLDHLNIPPDDIRLAAASQQ